MAKSFLVIVTKPPYGLEEAFAGLRLALAMAVNGMRTTVLMVEDGVFNAVSTQRPETIKMPSNIDAAKDLYDFDSQILVVKEDLEARGIPESRLFDGLKVVESAALKRLLSEHDLITTF